MSQRNLQAQLKTIQADKRPKFLIDCFTPTHKTSAKIELRYCNEFLR